MNKSFKKILFFYIIIVTIIIFSYLYSCQFIYDNVKVLKTPQENKTTLRIRIPSEIIISNDYLGQTTISDKFLMNTLLHYMNKISNYKNNDENTLTLKNTLPLSGIINYLNGDKDTFTISTELTINNNLYENNSYWINILRNTLKESLYTLTNFEKILDSPKSSIYFLKKNSNSLLDKNQKNIFIKSLKNLKVMEDNKDVLNTDLNELPKYHLTIYIDSAKGTTADNTFYFDIYNNYGIIQYLGDENGKNIYVKGTINENIFK